MKPLQLTASLMGLVLLGLGVAAVITNPTQPAYETFATQQLSQYLKENTCAKAGIALQGACNSVITQNRSQIQKLVASNTQRQNLLLLSLYKTDLSPGELLPDFLSNTLPSYHFETAGILGHFYIYQAQKR